ncbi:MULTISPECIES: SRPBCC family protein [Pseudomonas]|uniref:SRPBCC family protein n=1 Tax=Pseudomonas piscis TaxID=2614538 RepID=A0ABY9NBK8_9PSED|nr:MULTISPECIES: SRPBCC family protein [Pseudomonas]AZC19710.1 Aha1 domain superfamily [Pseudomonas sp. CMR5c]WMN15901.1 SRPBCC family protein [Pseudomonas piscis]
MNSSDRIERKVLLQASTSQVWAALSEAQSFGRWFGVTLAGQHFAPGQQARGAITYPGYEHLVLELQVQQMLPEELFSFRWHPYAVEPGHDYSSEPTTLVCFELDEHPEGTLLRVSESGFDAIPAERRLKAFRMNSRGWDEQMANIENYLRQQ